jgi:hypothetical protein
VPNSVPASLPACFFSPSDFGSRFRATFP